MGTCLPASANRSFVEEMSRSNATTSEEAISVLESVHIEDTNEPVCLAAAEMLEILSTSAALSGMPSVRKLALQT